MTTPLGSLYCPIDLPFQMWGKNMGTRKNEVFFWWGSDLPPFCGDVVHFLILNSHNLVCRSVAVTSVPYVGM